MALDSHDTHRGNQKKQNRSKGSLQTPNPQSLFFANHVENYFSQHIPVSEVFGGASRDREIRARML